MRHRAGEGAPLTSGYDAELRRHNEILRRAAGVRSREHVLDIGCGGGLTTREAARAAGSGSALGVDISAAAIERARELALAEGLGNVAFEQADAQVHGFPPERFDLAMSRFGTMFFTDPVAAFSGIGRALRPGGRLVMMVWQARELNEWTLVIRRSLEAVDGAAPGVTEGPNAFSLADPTAVREILRASGFADVAFTDVREPVFYGPDITAALDWVHGFTCTLELLKTRDPAAAARADERLRQAFAEHLSDDGVWFGSRAWLVTAHRP